MKFHWKVLLWMVAGVVAGLVMQATLDAPAWSGLTWSEAGGDGIVVKATGDPSKKLAVGDRIVAAVVRRGAPDEQRYPIATGADFAGLVANASNGEVLWVELASGKRQPIALEIDPTSTRARWLAPFDFAADIFMALLKMLIVPIILTSIISGVTSVGAMKDLGRLGGKTAVYYVSTSLLAILLGQTLVNVIRPGDGATLGLDFLDEGALAPEASFIDVLKRMIPSNVFAAFTDNGAMLQVIFFALLFGFFITRAPSPHRERMTDLFESGFQIMLRLAQGVLTLLPYGVFALMVRVCANTGFAAFEPLLLYMGTVTLALFVHALVTLPILLRVVGGISPVRWMKAMAPAVMTAFSTSSSSMTLPVTLETVEHRGRVSNKVTSFTLPLGATINMDGTALYECIGVIFLAQYYASTSSYELTWAMQGMIVLMALLASIGAAGIPSAGLVMMLTILAQLDLPLEGAALLLAVDRPLDMMRTVVNVWSDSCGAAIVARSEGEDGPLAAGDPVAAPGGP
jgi:Na+/H+-dicarboxylate symporter